jgi:pimeloyl-ACP methyl ester carboxylesterase
LLDVAELRRHVSVDNIADIICPYRASLNADFADLSAVGEVAATLQPPPVPTLYLHGVNDGAIGAELLGDVSEHLPAAGSAVEIVEGVGHFLHLEQPELIAAKISDWIER